MHHHISAYADCRGASSSGVNRSPLNTTCASTGTSAISTAVAPISTRTPRLSSRWANASPPSASDRIARTSCGTSTTLKTPPATRMYSELGSVLAVANTSALSDLPSTASSSALRTKPVSRDTTVPAAISALADSSLLWSPAESLTEPSPEPPLPLMSARDGPGRVRDARSGG